MPKPTERHAIQTRGVEGATSIQWMPEQHFPCQTSESGGFLYLSIANHGLAQGDVVSFRSPFIGETHITAANSTGFTVNGYYNSVSSGTTGVTYAVALPQALPQTINGIDLHSSDSTQRDKIHRLRVYNEDNIHDIRFASGYYFYLGTRHDFFMRPVPSEQQKVLLSGYLASIGTTPADISGTLANLAEPAFISGYQRTRYYVPEGFDPEASVSGGKIAGKFSYSDGRKGLPKTTKRYDGKE